ncbi:hypothetical protein PVAP13_1NG123919 [Panicum virgatum]|uniref:Uncharacterized protein n=1 Tax=Panicum virgatum TaxID=38727 RepID=A0A8T0WJ67_PANVG|nr:hypothetical protein PVAP13_1NG123919 [Panicum virgatum]
MIGSDRQAVVMSRAPARIQAEDAMDPTRRWRIGDRDAPAQEISPPCSPNDLMVDATQRQRFHNYCRRLAASVSVGRRPAVQLSSSMFQASRRRAIAGSPW